MNNSKNYMLWDVCNNIDVHVDDMDALMATMAFILESVNKAASDINGDPVKAVCFVERYQTFSKMLYAMLNGMQDHVTFLNTLIEREYSLLQSASSERAGE